MITGDFETRSIIDLRRLGVTKYAEHPLTQVLCFCWSYDDEEDVHTWHRGHPWIEKSPRPDELIERIREGEQFEAHNAAFEYRIWNTAMRREFPEFDVELKLEQLRCSAAKASCLSLPRALGDAATAMRITERKDQDGRRLINKLSKPMRRRRLIEVGDVPALKTAFRIEMLSEREMKRDLGLFSDEASRHFTLQNDAYPVILSFDIPKEKMVGALASARNEIHRWRDKGYCHGTGDGDWYWTDKPIPKREFGNYSYTKADVKFAIDQATAPIVWCEEESEHRRNWKYCEQDVRTERALSRELPEMTDREREYWLMDFNMNQRGVYLDIGAVDQAAQLCEREADRLNREMIEITEGQVLGGSKREQFKKWANDQLFALGAEPIENTQADTLSFKLYGVPTKAGDEAREAARPIAEAQWLLWGETGAKIKRAMEICLEVNRSSVAKFKQMRASVCDDGRLHDIMLYNGADRTGRWSGKGVQPHNFVRGYQKEMPQVWDNLLTADLDFITIMEGPALPCLAKACRGALVASPGKELYAADFNAIEARKLAWMSGCKSMLHLFETGGDPYIAMAASIYKIPIDLSDKDAIKLFKKERKNERNLGKKAVLGLGYAMGWEKFQATVWKDEGIWLDDEFCQMVVAIYRKDMCPEVPKFWKAAEDAAIKAVTEGGEWSAGGDEFGIGAISYFMDGRFLHCRLPSGRLLAYLDPEVHTKVNYRYRALNERGNPCIVSFHSRVGVGMSAVKFHAVKIAEKQRKTLLDDAPDAFLSPHLSFMGRDTFTHQWKRCGTHGGTLVENADQASSRDLLAEAMFRVDRTNPFALLLSIHDEVIAEAPVGTATVSEFESIMSEVPAWAPGMPISAEGWIGSRLRK